MSFGMTTTGARQESAGAGAAVVELVFGNFATEGVAMNAEDFGGTRLVAVGAFEDALDEALFEFAYGLIEEDTALDHQGNQTFQLISHGRSSATEN